MQRNTPIQQNTPEWLDAKRSTIGGSEIYNLVLAFTTPEERKQYLPFFEEEKAFGSIMQTAIKFLYGISPEFDKLNREYGNAMELPTVNFFNEKYNGVLNAEYTRDFIQHNEYRNISCSPDGYVELEDIVNEYGSEVEITKDLGYGLLELKTTQHKDAFKEEAKMQYLFQCNWNAWVCGLNWYAVVLCYPKDFDLEKPEEKGKRIAYADVNNYTKIYETVDFQEYFYKTNNAVINLCKLAYSRFVKKIKEARELPLERQWTVFPFSSETKKFEEEKALLRQVPIDEIQEKFGVREASAEEVDLFVERRKNAQEIKRLQERNNEITGHFLKEIKDHEKISTEIDGKEYRCKYDTKGSLRFYPN